MRDWELVKEKDWLAELDWVKVRLPSLELDWVKVKEKEKLWLPGRQTGSGSKCPWFYLKDMSLN